MTSLRRTVARIATAPSWLRERRDELRGLRRDVVALRQRVADAEAAEGELKRRIGSAKKEIARLHGIIGDLRSAEARRMLPDRVADAVEGVLAEHLTFLTWEPLTSLAKALLDVEVGGVEGAVIEAGTARGGSAIVLGSAKSPERQMLVFDVFGMIPPPGDNDGDDVHSRYDVITSGKARGPVGDTYYGYRDDLLGEVTASFTRYGLPLEESRIRLVRGLFQDTIVLDSPVAFAHIDGDWYESTRTCLERIVPHLSVGGRLVIDDYFAWSGCRTAVDEFFAGRDEFELTFGSRLHVVRRAPDRTTDIHQGIR